MIFGGFPYYLDALDERLSLAQNIDRQWAEEYRILLGYLLRQLPWMICLWRVGLFPQNERKS